MKNDSVKVAKAIDLLKRRRLERAHHLFRRAVKPPAARLPPLLLGIQTSRFEKCGHPCPVRQGRPRPGAGLGCSRASQKTWIHDVRGSSHFVKDLVKIIEEFHLKGPVGVAGLQEMKEDVYLASKEKSRD